MIGSINRSFGFRRDKQMSDASTKMMGSLLTHGVSTGGIALTLGMSFFQQQIEQLPQETPWQWVLLFMLVMAFMQGGLTMLREHWKNRKEENAALRAHEIAIAKLESDNNAAELEKDRAAQAELQAAYRRDLDRVSNNLAEIYTQLDRVSTQMAETASTLNLLMLTNSNVKEGLSGIVTNGT